MKFSFLFFSFLLHVGFIFSSQNDILCSLVDTNESIPVPENNQILQSIMKANPLDAGFKFEHYPLYITLKEWECLNYCYDEKNVEKISAEKIMQAIMVASNVLGSVQVIKEEEISVMDVLLQKAKNILDINDFKNFDEEKVNQIQELKELKNYILYPYKLMQDVYKKQEILKIPNADYGDYTPLGHHIPNEAKQPDNQKFFLTLETICWSIFLVVTYLQPLGFSFLIAPLHAYIFQNSMQKWFSWYSYAQQFQQLQLSCFVSRDKKYGFKKELNNNTAKHELYIVDKKTQQKYLLDKKKYRNHLKVLSMDNTYISCSNFVYDIQNQSTISIEKNYMVMAYLAHDVYLLVKIDQFKYSNASTNSTRELLTLSNFIHRANKEKISEIGIGKKIDDQIQLICSLKKYTESTGFPSDILLSTNRTKLFIYFLEERYDRQKNKDIVEIFSLPDPKNVSYDDLFAADNIVIEKIKPLKGIFFYVALLLFLYKSGYFFLRDRIILEEYKKSCELADWHALILKSMRSFKNKFFPPIKRFLRREYIRVAKENIYARDWEKIF